MFTNDSYISPRCSSPLFGRARRPNLQSLLESLPAHVGAPFCGAPTHASTGTSRPQVIGFTLLVERNALNANPRTEGRVGRPLHELQPACGEALLRERPKRPQVCTARTSACLRCSPESIPPRRRIWLPTSSSRCWENRQIATGQVPLPEHEPAARAVRPGSSHEQSVLPVPAIRVGVQLVRGDHPKGLLPAIRQSATGPRAMGSSRCRYTVSGEQIGGCVRAPDTGACPRSSFWGTGGTRSARPPPAACPTGASRTRASHPQSADCFPRLNSCR